MMKVDIEIVTGFIGSGKTKFIHSLIENTFVSGERIVILQCESGNTEPSQVIKENPLVKIKKLELIPHENFRVLEYIMGIYNPHRVIIEFNGTRRIEDFLEIYQNSKLRTLSRIKTIYHLSDAVTFETYINNMGAFILGSIINSDLIIINNVDCVEKEGVQWIRTKIKELNPEAYVLELPCINSLDNILKKEDLLDGGFLKKCSVFLKNIHR